MALPKRIGTYEILGPLATGGMAEILLGRRLGPGRFERLVVVKRILPHLVHDSSFEAMFLDEARIAAAIHHPNVVQVSDMGRAEEELFLVMEYLEGESASAILRRLTARGRTMDSRLAAFLVAEVCAGLHAAHELVGTDGAPQNLVHRDVSPQNVFVTYDGGVKVLDFGIAKAVDRIERTKTGDRKGKLSYMSPEQCEGEPLDRRSDVFSLGIVLFELSTGHRLFKRPTELMVLDAIAREPVPRPSQVVQAYPAELESICLRALSRSPDARYPNAAAMRRDLMRVAKELPGDDGREDLAALMLDLFADRAEAKAELVRLARDGEWPALIPPGETDLMVEVPPVARKDRTRENRDDVPTKVDAPRQRFAWSVVLLFALAGITLLVFQATHGARGHAVALLPSTADTPEAAASPAVPDPASNRALAPSRIVLHVETQPSGARVSVNGEARGVTPVDVSVARGPDPILVQMAKAGFARIEEHVVPDRDQDLVLSLVKDRSRSSRGPGEPTPPTATSSTAEPFHKFE